MSTALVPIADLERFAAAFARSGMFGTKTVDQALSLLLLAQAEGVHPAIAMRDFDIIQGRPAKKAEAMHRAFLAAGGRITWHALTDELADATFSHPDGGEARITWDMARAQKAGLKNKDMYAKYPRQMLKARVVSEGCRTVYPAATSGLYVPEEVAGFAKPQPEKDMGSIQPVADDDEDITQQIPGAGREVAPPQAQASPSPSHASPAGVAVVSVDQVTLLRDLFKESDKDAEASFLRIAKLAKLDDLKAEDFDEAVDWAQRRRARQQSS